MNSFRKSCWAALGLALVVGCEKATPPSVPQGPVATAPTADPKPTLTRPDATDKVDAPKPADPAGKVDSAKTKLSEDEVAAINKLPSEDDRKLATAQLSCPISDDHLGAMGMPVKVVLKDQTVFLCCAGCVKDAKAKPDETLAKLGKK